jgi:hypothetical protein
VQPATREIIRKVRISMTPEEDLHGIRPRASRCYHDYPMEVRIYEGGHRARCLRCQALGPVSSDADAARKALLEERSKR